LSLLGRTYDESAGPLRRNGLCTTDLRRGGICPGHRPFAALHFRQGRSFCDAADDIANTSRVGPGQTAASLTKTDSDDTVVPVGVAIGYNWRKHGVSLRTEFEYLNRSNFGYMSNPAFTNSGTPISLSSKIGSQTLFANVFYDFHNATLFTPFVGGGIGVAINKSTTTLNFIGSPVFDTFETIDTRFAWNIGAGVAVPITEILLLELSYRYTDLGGAVWSTRAPSS
jgi:opacity protein-like surface antigen